jgi:glyoxylase-like metal-dependent hydrolase (beta-lactamase superfamily II)
MKQITQDMYMLEDVGSASAFVLVSSDGFTLIDTGMTGRTQQLMAQLEENRYALSKLQTIVLTHCHCDHAGGAAELVERSGAKVAAHQDEIPYITQEEILPASPWCQRLMLRHQYGIDHIDIVLQDGDTINALGGLHVIHVPGHTPGSIALYQTERRIMFFGDVMFNQKRGLRIAPDSFNTDTAQTEKAARKLAAYPIDIACFGHGPPMLEHAGEDIRKTLNVLKKKENILKEGGEKK